MVQLTQTVKKGGCAAKIAANTLREILSSLEIPNKHPDLLIGNATLDDAAVYKISDELALIETLDFFTPIVDDPFKFGKIAAVNALSDVYAMGGDPKTCLAILAFPLATLDESIMKDVLAGACSGIREADALLVGGHSIDDDTLKFGLSVSGHVHPQKIWSNANARPGDKLILTKPLGTGTLTAGLKRKEFTEEDIMEALDSMMLLNEIKSTLNDELLGHIHSATDITGFGLMGHSLQMAQMSHVSFKIKVNNVPSFGLAKESLEKGFLTKAHGTNKKYVSPFSSFDQSLKEWQYQLLFDPQTSGGLLLSVESSKSDELIAKLKNKFPHTTEIGRVMEKSETRLIVE